MAAVIPRGLTLSVTVGGILLVTGWMGGELSYRYRVGVTPREGSTAMDEPTSIHQRRAA